MGTLSRVIFDPDTTPPSIPGSVTATALSQTTIRVAWAASTDTGGSGLAGYRVLRSTTSGGTYSQVGGDLSTSSLVFDDTSLTAGTTRFYRIVAFDLNSNLSSQSSAVNATTLSGGTVSFAHGQSFTITGSNFGTRGHYGPAGRMTWKILDFEDQLESDGWNLNDPAYASLWQWMSTGNRTSRSTRWAKRFSHGNPSNQEYIRTSTSFSTGKLFFSIWHFNAPGANGKTWRVWFNNGVNDLWLNYGTGSVASDSPNQFVDGGAIDIPDNTWVRMDHYVRNGGNGLLIDISRVGFNGNNPVYTKNYNCPGGLGTFLNPAIGAGEDGPGPSVYWGFDECYWDFTPARVEIANTNTWAARTKAELQRPASWSNTSITFTVNAGAFAAGETAYIYVIKDDTTVVGPVQSVTVQ